MLKISSEAARNDIINLFLNLEASASKIAKKSFDIFNIQTTENLMKTSEKALE